MSMSTLDSIKADSAKLGTWAHLATVGADGEPDVTPVHPAWADDTIWVLVFGNSTKVRNVGHEPRVALHWQVDERGDGVEVWGTATVHTDDATKQRLWQGVFDYDLNDFAPGGPDNSPHVAFMAITPTRAVAIRQYGMGGTDHWRA